MERTKLMTDNHVLCGQSYVVEQLMRTDERLMDYLPEDENDEILEWWLVTPFLAEQLKREGETVLAEYGCHWWGRTQSGQALYMDRVFGRICKRLN